MPVLFTIVALLSLGFILDYMGAFRLVTGAPRRAGAPVIPAQPSPVTGAALRATPEPVRFVAPSEPDAEAAAVIGSVLSKLDELEPGEIRNIFAEDTTRPISRPEIRNAAGIPAEGKETVIEVARWRARPSMPPMVLSGFDTETDRVLIVHDVKGPPPRLHLYRDRSGLPMLCCDRTRLVVFPALKGNSPIDTLLLDVG